MAAPEHGHGYLGNVAFFRMLFRKAGDSYRGHVHSYDHPTFVCRGAVDVVVNDQVTPFDEDDVIAIAHGVEHQIIARKDNTLVLCVHAYHDKADPRAVLDPRSVPKGVHPMMYSVPLIFNDAVKSVADFEELSKAR